MQLVQTDMEYIPWRPELLKLPADIIKIAKYRGCSSKSLVGCPSDMTWNCAPKHTRTLPTHAGIFRLTLCLPCGASLADADLQGKKWTLRLTKGTCHGCIGSFALHQLRPRYLTTSFLRAKATFNLWTRPRPDDGDKYLWNPSCLHITRSKSACNQSIHAVTVSPTWGALSWIFPCGISAWPGPCSRGAR